MKRFYLPDLGIQLGLQTPGVLGTLSGVGENSLAAGGTLAAAEGSSAVVGGNPVAVAGSPAAADTQWGVVTHHSVVGHIPECWSADPFGLMLNMKKHLNKVHGLTCQAPTDPHLRAPWGALVLDRLKKQLANVKIIIEIYQN